MQVLGKVLWKGMHALQMFMIEKGAQKIHWHFCVDLFFGNKFAKWYRNMMKINKGKNEKQLKSKIDLLIPIYIHQAECKYQL